MTKNGNSMGQRTGVEKERGRERRRKKKKEQNNREEIE